MVGAFMDRSVDQTLKELAARVGITKSDLLRRFILEGIAGVNRASDWRRLLTQG